MRLSPVDVCAGAARAAAMVLALASLASCSNITDAVFAGLRDGMPAAFGDFNSDELTDIFVVRNGKRTLEILLAAEEEPLFRPSNLRCNFTHPIRSVVPGDFDGDAFMDVLVTTSRGPDQKETWVHIMWGGMDHLNCSDGPPAAVRLRGQPLVLDYNQDMIMDLFGADPDGRRAFWIFNKNRTAPERVEMEGGGHGRPALRHPHSHAFLDLNDDFTADLFLTTEDGFELWRGTEDGGEFVWQGDVPPPPAAHTVGQSVWVDVELVGRLDLLTPVCRDAACEDGAILVHTADGGWHDLQVSLKDSSGAQWGFVAPEAGAAAGEYYTDAVSLRTGDFNMDGYPDLLATLTTTRRASRATTRAVLLENVPCSGPGGSAWCAGNYSRTYVVRWRALEPFTNGTVMAVFYDLYQDGVLDVLLVQQQQQQQQGGDGGGTRTVAAFRNSLDYDANFVKVMVLTGLTNNKRAPTIVGRLGKKKRTYGTNLPGPRVSYRTTTQEGLLRHGVSAQLPQSAHFSLALPYTTFGLGRTPNFVDSLTVGLCNRSRDWPQIIPNSQMVVIPWPVRRPSRWRAQLFVTPSKLILMSVAALTAVCGLITVIIAALYWRERQEDRKERLQESHRFHFDAM